MLTHFESRFGFRHAGLGFGLLAETMYLLWHGSSRSLLQKQLNLECHLCPHISMHTCILHRWKTDGDVCRKSTILEIPLAGKAAILLPADKHALLPLLLSTLKHPYLLPTPYTFRGHKPTAYTKEGTRY